MRKKILLLAIMVLGIAATPRAQDVALKTNFLYWASATPNLGIEASIADKHSLQLFYGWNPWKYSETKRAHTDTECTRVCRNMNAQALCAKDVPE